MAAHRPKLDPAAWEAAVIASRVERKCADRFCMFSALQTLLNTIEDPTLVLIGELSHLALSARPCIAPATHGADLEASRMLLMVIELARNFTVCTLTSWWKPLDLGSSGIFQVLWAVVASPHAAGPVNLPGSRSWTSFEAHFK